MEKFILGVAFMLAIFTLVVANYEISASKPDFEQQLHSECKTHGRYIAKDFVLKCELFEFRRSSK